VPGHWQIWASGAPGHRVFVVWARGVDLALFAPGGSEISRAACRWVMKKATGDRRAAWVTMTAQGARCASDHNCPAGDDDCPTPGQAARAIVGEIAAQGERV